MEYSLAYRRPLQFSEGNGAQCLHCCQLPVPFRPRGWQRAHCFTCSSKDCWLSGHSQSLSFVLGEIRNKLLPAQEALRQKPGASGKVQNCRQV